MTTTKRTTGVTTLMILAAAIAAATLTACDVNAGEIHEGTVTNHRIYWAFKKQHHELTITDGIRVRAINVSKAAYKACTDQADEYYSTCANT